MKEINFIEFINIYIYIYIYIYPLIESKFKVDKRLYSLPEKVKKEKKKITIEISLDRIFDHLHLNFSREFPSCLIF